MSRVRVGKARLSRLSRVGKARLSRLSRSFDKQVNVCDLIYMIAELDRGQASPAAREAPMMPLHLQAV